jgi:CBS domain-containing protein
MPIPIASVLQRKGSEVVSIRPDVTISEAADILAEHNIGALVVSVDGDAVAGIISERDIVRDLAEFGASCLDKSVGELMTSPVTTCSSHATTDEVMAIMTEGRIRHVPVVDEGHLVGIVSIGDVVKSRMDELQLQKEGLEDYVTGSAY